MSAVLTSQPEPAIPSAEASASAEAPPDGARSAAPARVVSVDALRGFDMFWITGGREMLLGLVWLLFGTIPVSVDAQLRHPDWQGFVAWDMIMPLFLFVTGVAMPFSLSRRIEGGAGQAAVYLRILRRLVILWILGMIAQGNLIACLTQWDFTKLKLYSNTLQAIAAGYVITALALLHLPRLGQAVLCAALLLGYWALLTFVPYGGHAAGTLEPMQNIAKHVDKAVLGRFSDRWHYTWVLSSMGFGSTVLLGAFAGHILKSGLGQREKLRALVSAGFACLVCGGMWSLFHPIIKHIWTSSMNLWAAGWSFLLLAFFYWFADMRGFRKIAFPFVVIGSNAIVAYMAGEYFVEHGGASRILKALGTAPSAAGYAGAALFFFILWGILYGMYRKRIYVRI